jgi:hypothetical protein
MPDRPRSLEYPQVPLNVRRQAVRGSVSTSPVFLQALHYDPALAMFGWSMSAKA